MPKLKQSILTIVIGLALAAGISYASHGQWHGATANPPLENTPAPVNVSKFPQIKDGVLQVNGFRNIGDSIFDGLIKIPTGAGPGKVLTSDAFGNASWQTLPEIKTGGKVNEMKSKRFTTNGAFTAPAGVTTVYVSLVGGGGGGGGGYSVATGRGFLPVLYAPGGGGGG